MITPFHGCPFILTISVLPVQTSCYTSGTVYFRGTFKMLLAIVSCIVISHNDVDCGLYIFTDWYQFWSLMSTKYVWDIVSVSCQLSIGTKYRPDVLMQWVSSLGSGSMCMNMSRNWTIVTSKWLATVVCSAANFFQNEFCVYEWVLFCSMESGW